MASVEIRNPTLPFWDAIPGGLAVGKTIRIKGLFPTTIDTSEYSQINLCEYSPDVIPLHLSIRFNHRQVIRNTFQRNNWQTEEKDGAFPFALGKQFLIEILVQSHGYQISVNSQHCWTYAHRLPYVSVTHLNIDGSPIIWSVEYITKHNQAQQRYFPPSPTPTSSMLTNNPCLPYWEDLPQRLAVGSTFKIRGVFPTSIDTSKYTEFNLCQNSASIIGLHLSIRFNHNVVVRNSFRQGRWETEEKGGPFPFALGREFLIQILVRPDAYQISVNGAHCWMFAHRLPLELVNGLNIDGPVRILHVDYVNNKAQKQMQVQQNFYPTPQAPLTLEPVYNPPVPFSYHIDGGIKSGMMIYISGIPAVNFQRFTISLQCGRQQKPSTDIAFHFDVRGYNATVVRNSRRNKRWEDEETAASYFPFYPSSPFDMMILVQNDKYMVAVNGSHFIEYYHRMSRFGLINTLRIENDVRITSVRFDA